MGKRGPKKGLKSITETKGWYWVPQKQGNTEGGAKRLVRHSVAARKGFRPLSNKDLKEKPEMFRIGLDAKEKEKGPNLEISHRHKLLDEKRSNVYHPISELHPEDADLSEHLDELAKREHAELGKPSERVIPWFERLNLEVEHNEEVKLKNGSVVPAEIFKDNKIGNMYLIERGVTTFVFNVPKYNFIKTFEKRDKAIEFIENFVKDKRKEEISQKAFNFIEKTNILQKVEKIKNSIYSTYKSGNNIVELSGENDEYIVKVNNSELLSTSDLSNALKGYYQQIENLSSKNSENSDISLDILGNKVVQMNREALSKLSELGDVQKILTKMNKLIKARDWEAAEKSGPYLPKPAYMSSTHLNRWDGKPFKSRAAYWRWLDKIPEPDDGDDEEELEKAEPQIGIIHGVQESEEINQGVQETGNKPRKLEENYKYIQEDQLPGRKQSEVENKEQFFKDEISFQKEHIYISDESEVPKGYKPERGPRGGIYYDTERKPSGVSSEDYEEPSKIEVKKEKISRELAQKVGESIGIDFTKIDLTQFYVGINVELEHGTISPETNITNDDLPMTGKIALAHINEVPDYYTKLENYVDSEYIQLFESDKISKEEGMIPFIPEEFAGNKEIEQPKKVSPKYKDSEKKQEPIKFDKSENDEPDFYFKSDDIYECLDMDYFSKMGVAFDPNQIIPSGAKSLGINIEKELYHSLRNSIDDWYMTVRKDSALGKAKINLKENLLKWQMNSTKNISNDIQKIFEKGITAGIRQSGVEVEQKYYGDINYQLNKPTGILPAIENFQNQIYDKISNILTKNYDEEDLFLDVKKAGEEIDSFMINQRYRTELMVKSEVASLSNYGMLKAWEKDPEKEKYRYYWKAIVDSRSKPISILRKQGNPYSYFEINYLWKNQVQLINGKFMNDRYFQRCGLARGKFKLDYNFKKNRFLGQENEFKETL